MAVPPPTFPCRGAFDVNSREISARRRPLSMRRDKHDRGGRGGAATGSGTCQPHQVLSSPQPPPAAVVATSLRYLCRPPSPHIVGTPATARTFLPDISDPTSCLHHLLSELREHSSASRPRNHEKYLRRFTRTERYCSYIQHSLNHCQSSTANKTDVRNC